MTPGPRVVLAEVWPVARWLRPWPGGGPALSLRFHRRRGIAGVLPPRQRRRVLALSNGECELQTRAASSARAASPVRARLDVLGGASRDPAAVRQGRARSSWACVDAASVASSCDPAPSPTSSFSTALPEPSDSPASCSTSFRFSVATITWSSPTFLGGVHCSFASSTSSSHEASTPASVGGRASGWRRGLRPAWVVRASSWARADPALCCPTDACLGLRHAASCGRLR